MANEVQYIHSGMRAAPALSGTAGALLTVLEAWRTGFAATTATGVTVAAGVATATVPSGDTFSPGTVIEVGGGPSSINGRALVLSNPNGTTITFATTAPNGSIAGTLTLRVAPSGWGRPYSGTNLAAYKPTAVEATGHLLRLDDSGASTTRARGFESMTTINDGLGRIPLDAQVNGGVWWPKSATADAAARPWFVVSDARGMYVGVDPAGNGRYTLLFAGDFASLKSGDAWSFAVTGNTTSQTAGSTPPEGCCGYSGRTSRAGAYVSRAHNGAGGAIQVQRIGAHHNGATSDCYSGTLGYSNSGAYPNGPNNGLLLTPVELVLGGVRGTLPGLYHAVQDCADGFSTGAMLDGTDDLAGRKLLAVRCAPGGAGMSAGTVFMDITGPWPR